MSDTNGTVADLVDAQIRSQGVGCVAVDDGHVFTFTLATLEDMVKRAQEHGKCILFVRHGALS